MIQYFGYLKLKTENGKTILLFEDIKAKFLNEKEKAQASYVFKFKDSFEMVTILDDKGKIVFFGRLHFTELPQGQIVVPANLEESKWRKAVYDKNIVSIKTDKELYTPAIIEKAKAQEKSLIYSEILSLCHSDDSILSADNLIYKKALLNAKNEFDRLFNDNSLESFINFIIEPQKGLYGSSPLELILRGQSENLLFFLANLKNVA